MALYDAIQSAFQTAQNFKRIGLLGSAHHGHFSLRGMAADPTTTAHYEGRFWFRTNKAGLYFRGLVKAATYGTLRLPGALEGSLGSLDLASLADGAGISTNVTVTGAELGDYCVGSLGLSAQGMIVNCTVLSPDTVALRIQNESGGPIDLSSTTARALVFKRT